MSLCWRWCNFPIMCETSQVSGQSYQSPQLSLGPWILPAHGQELCPQPRVACLLTLPVQSVCLRLTPGAEASSATMQMAFLPVVVFAAQREIILLGFALIVMNMHRAISLRSKCLPGRASWRIRGQDHHRVGKCMLTTVYAPLSCCL